MQLRAGVLGGGSWGTTVASLVSRNMPTRLWLRRAAIADEINRNHTNETYLPGCRLSRRLTATTDLEEVVSQADLLVIGVPSKGMRETLAEVSKYLRAWVPIISLTKGLEPGTGFRMTQIIDEALPGHPTGVLAGPNLAREIAQGFAAASVLAMADEVIVKQLQPYFTTGVFRSYTNTDVIGCELGGALKNVIAIASGMGDGAGAGENTRSAVITRGLAEITRLGRAMGGRARTFAGLAGVGDLMATCTSRLSRNHTVGYQLGQGRTIEEVVASMNQVAEGVNSAVVVMQLAERYGIEMPIANEVYKVCHEGQTAREAFRGLLRWEMGDESDPG